MRLLLAALVLALGGATTGLALASAGPASTYVAHISGSSAYGFRVGWSDGHRWWTPTLSETLAGCTEYGAAQRQARCEAAARSRYRWLGILKRSLRHRATR